MNKKIFDEIKKFQDSLPENASVIVGIDGKKIFLENVSELDENILIFEGVEFQTNFKLKFFVSKNNVNFFLENRFYSKNHSVDESKLKIKSRQLDIE